MALSRRDLTRRLLAMLPAGLLYRSGVDSDRGTAWRQEVDQRSGRLSNLAAEGEIMTERISLTSIEGLRVGHHTRDDRPTGCTVVLAEAGAVAGVDVRGAAPGTRETDLLRPQATVGKVHAICLAGGSAFGLAAADGVMEFLRRRGVGFPTANGPVPIVPAAILYDLGVGGGTSHPDADDGTAACAAASTVTPDEGNVGAGAGATVGKIFGTEYAMKGGIGSAGFRFADGTVVATLVAVNCRGDVRDPASGRLIAGARAADGHSLRNSQATLLAGAAGEPLGPSNTTIGVVATNHTMDKSACTHLAAIAHDGLARAVIPAHTRFDGDTFFFLATGTAGPIDASADDRLEAAVAASVSAAILRAVRRARGLPGYPSASELGTG
ncbi:MAG: P1 family peptidase [Acidobacteriota bacterium]